MILYLIIIILVLGMVGIECCERDTNLHIDSGTNIKKLYNVKNIAWLAWGILFLITACRADTIGNDTDNYILYFNTVLDEGLKNTYKMEEGFELLNYIVSRISNNPHVLLFIVATISYLFIGYYIYTNSLAYSASICIFMCTLFTFYLSGIRQGLAMIILLYCYWALKKDNKKVAVILLVVAFFFHRSSIIFGILFLHKFFPRKYKVIYGTIILTLFISLSGIIVPILSILGGRYSGYLEGMYVFSGWLANSVNMLKGLVCLFFILCVQAKEHDEDSSVMRANAIMLCLCFCMGYSVNIFDRVANIFWLPMIVDLPNSMVICKKKRWLILVCVAFALYFVAQIVLKPEWNHIYPYHFFWV